MKRKISIIFLLAAALFLCTALPAQATIITFDLDYEFSGATPPESLTTPWLTATFDDGGTAGSVTLTMQAINLTDAEHVKQWLFNFDPDLKLDSLKISRTSGQMAAVYKNPGNNDYKADGGGYFDIKFDWQEPGTDIFGVGAISVYDISLHGITANSFNYSSVPSGGNGTYWSAAHIGGIGIGSTDGDSGWIGAPVPEPSTMLLLGFGLICIAGFSRKKFLK